MCTTVGDDLATELLIDRDVAVFRVHTAQRLCAERLAHIGFEAQADGCFERRLTATPQVQQIHARFAKNLRTIVLQSARLTHVPWEDALDEAAERLAHSGIDWWLYGSAALAVRGLEVDPGDVDLAVEDAHHAGRIFEDVLIEPVSGPLDWVMRWGGRGFHGALFEWSAEPSPHADASPCEHGRWAAGQLETVSWRGRRLRLPPLHVHHAVSVHRGDHERANQVRRLM